MHPGARRHICLFLVGYVLYYPRSLCRRVGDHYVRWLKNRLRRDDPVCLTFTHLCSRRRVWRRVGVFWRGGTGAIDGTVAYLSWDLSLLFSVNLLVCLGWVGFCLPFVGLGAGVCPMVRGLDSKTNCQIPEFRYL